MTATLATAPQTLTVAEIMDRNRASVPRITCEGCHTETARSNSYPSPVCDDCLDILHPAAALCTPHGVSWQRNG